MKVVELRKSGGLDNLVVVERDGLVPGVGEVVVRWHATSLNFHDYLVATGGIPVADGRIPMSDGAGVVTAVGDGVDIWKVGDEVMSLFFPNWDVGRPTLPKMVAIGGESVDGCMAEFACLKADSLARMPKGYSFVEAATLPCAALTAWRALMVEGKLQKGQRVLIEGTGGMSIFGLQLALAAGAEVYATTSSNAKAERLKEMGVKAVVNYKEDARWGKTILGMTGGVHHVLDVGGGSTMKQSIEAVAIDGHIASIGILGDGRKGEITFPKLFFKQVRLTGLAVGSREMQVEMVGFLEEFGVKPVVDLIFGFEGLGDAFRYQASGGHFGKICLRF